MERRRHTRERYTAPVTIETADGATYPAETRDMSAGGLSLRTDYLLPPCLPCRVVKDEGGELLYEGTVVHTRDLDDGAFKLGLQFDGPCL